MNHPTTTTLNGMCQESRCLGIKLLTQGFVYFCVVNSRKSGTVHDTINGMLIKKSLDSILIGDIQFLYIRIKIGVLQILLFQQLHLVAQLSVTACY